MKEHLDLARRAALEALDRESDPCALRHGAWIPMLLDPIVRLWRWWFDV